MGTIFLVAGTMAALGLFIPVLWARVLLSRAKHPSLQGHAQWSKRIARWVPFYEYDEDRFFDSDGAPSEIAEQRKAGFRRLTRVFGNSETVTRGDQLESGVSDLQFT